MCGVVCCVKKGKVGKIRGEGGITQVVQTRPRGKGKNVASNYEGSVSVCADGLGDDLTRFYPRVSSHKTLS